MNILGYLPSSDTFFKGYHLMDFLEVAALFWTIWLVNRTLKSVNEGVAAAQEAVKAAREDSEQDRRDFTQSLHDTRYDAVDGMYFEINKMRIATPDFSNPELMFINKGANSEEWTRYSAYAFIMWNFIETICDKCAKDKSLMDTWAPIITTEAALHSKWFLEVDPQSGNYKNHASFKKCFISFAKSLINLRNEGGAVTNSDLRSLLTRYCDCCENSSGE